MYKIYLYYYNQCHHCFFIKTIIKYLKLDNQFILIDFLKTKNVKEINNISLPLLFYIDEKNNKKILDYFNLIKSIYIKFNLKDDKDLLSKVLEKNPYHYNIFLHNHNIMLSEINKNFCLKNE